MGKPSSYRDLEIYTESKILAVAEHKMTLTLPKFELYEEGSQLRRSSKAVTAAIVEGFGRRRWKPDYIKHLVYSITECDESILHLDFLFETGSLRNENDYRSFKERYDVLSKRINKFIQWLEGE
jgi:four helix bundle protein